MLIYAVTLLTVIISVILAKITLKLKLKLYHIKSGIEKGNMYMPLKTEED